MTLKQFDEITIVNLPYFSNTSEAQGFAWLVAASKYQLINEQQVLRPTQVLTEAFTAITVVEVDKFQNIEMIDKLVIIFPKLIPFLNK